MIKGFYQCLNGDHVASGEEMEGKNSPQSMRKVKMFHRSNYRTESQNIPVPKPGRNYDIMGVICLAS